ncbi:hypothetical protein N6H18_06575 [Reichenbachiella agarivorans]|uniref:STAS/SEC14 domain-containing protein n=1 Tax=Reichenbachiella agarivorans TaxID=2979464 RepID=A0ABY6CSX1_9BACT|nr:hypothetical protein [Reichenbachiella agarivorans]UXP33617.1 hypothetical protein N6H18_06575 [Reichenbachiella agarivorans]
MNSFYEKPGVVNTSLDLITKSMHVKWTSLSDDKAIEECCLAQVEQVKNGIQKMYLDVSDAVGVPSQARQKWFETELFPTFSKYGMKVVINILPKSAITKLASKKWVSVAAPFDFDMFDAADLKSAKELASKY